jgi:hypothetical protein
MDGQHGALITYQGIFLRVEKPSDDINSRLFLMNKKGLTKYCIYLDFLTTSFLYHLVTMALKKA